MIIIFKILQENTINNIDQTFKTRYEVNIQKKTNIFLITFFAIFSRHIYECEQVDNNV
jgi:hypothetical protein